MAETVGYVAETGDDDHPFKVVFTIDDKVIAEHYVSSRLSGEKLIERLLPILKGFSP